MQRWLIRHPHAAQQRGMPEADARWLFQQLLVAVEYCHLLGIANRDVKVPLLPHLCLLMTPCTRWVARDEPTSTALAPMCRACSHPHAYTPAHEFGQAFANLCRYNGALLLQLDNMLLHGGGLRPLLKLCDFGFSRVEVATKQCDSSCGTPEYMAPEVLFEEVRAVTQQLAGVSSSACGLAGWTPCHASNIRRFGGMFCLRISIALT